MSQKNKLDSENEEKARQSAERKANDALLVNSNLELHKNAGVAFSSIKDIGTVFSTAMPQLVQFMNSPSTENNTSFTTSNSSVSQSALS